MTHDGLRDTLGRLDADWERLAPPGRPVPAAWGLACPPLRDVPELRAVPAAVRVEPDGILLGLLSLHRAGDALAGRLVLQMMLGKAVRMALRDPAVGLPDYLAALWERICTYPVERRPTRVAANLALDTLKAVVAARKPVPVALLPAAGAPEPGAGEVLDAAARLGVIDAATHRTLECVYLQGRSSRAAASELGMSSDVVRWRCSRGVRALRAHATRLAAELAG